MCMQLALVGPRYSNDAATSWARLPMDLLLQTFSLEGMADAPLLRAAIACRSWQYALGRFTQSLSFTWCSQQSHHQVRHENFTCSVTAGYWLQALIYNKSGMHDPFLSSCILIQINE